MSQADLGRLLGKTGAAVSSWELGVRDPPVADLIRLALIFGRPVDALLGLDPGEAPPTPKHPAWVTALLPDLARLDRAGRNAVTVLVKGLSKLGVGDSRPPT
jgi:transcriptional regulator with XRE-family HTH domain